MDNGGDSGSNGSNATKPASVTRRGFIGAGIGISAVGLTKSSLQSTVTIPLLSSEDGVEKSTDVPLQWWEHVQQSKIAAKVVEDKYGSWKEVTDVTRSSDDAEVAGKKKKKINLHIDPREAPEIPLGPGTDNGPFPERVEGTRVVTTEMKNKEATACKNVGTWYSVPGGTGIFNSAGGKGSITPVKENGVEKILTVAHIDCSGGGFYQQSDQTEYLGATDSIDSKYDWQTVSISNRNKTMDNRIRFPDGSRYPVKGWVNKEGVEDYEASGKEFYKVGAEEGKSKNVIHDYYGNFDDSCSNYSNKAIFMKNNGAVGDSGCPTFLLTDQDNAFMLLFNQLKWGNDYWVGCSGKPESGGSGGLAAWWIQNNTGLSFDVA